MIPIHLTLEGLYSYKERQEIDFEPLIAAGLFGLFGSVGSGKSSILEAIMLALYNKTERISSGRNYNIMNLQSNELFIDFIFYAGPGNSSKYRATYSSKRNSKDFNDVKVRERNYYKWENSTWTPLENIDNAKDILGMSYDNFMKTVIIPQGKFRDFIDQSPSARAQMLKDLFPLEQFDLFNKTSRLLSQNKADIQSIEKLLEEIGAPGQEDIALLEKEIETLEHQEVESGKKLGLLRKEEEKMRVLEKLFSTYYEVADKLHLLKSEEELFKNKTIQLQTYHKAYTYFKEKLTALSQCMEELQYKKQFLLSLTEQAKKADGELNRSKEKFMEAKNGWEQIETTKSKCEDLKVIIEISKIKQKAGNLEEAAISTKAEVAKMRQSVVDVQSKIEAGEAKILTLEDNLQDAEQLNALLHWLEQEVALKKETDECDQQLNELAQKQTSYKHQLIRTMEKHGMPGNNDLDKALATISREKAMLTQKLHQLQESLMPLKLKHQLSEYASALQDDQPCPLCGALHHPEPVVHGTVSQEIQEVEEHLTKVKNQETTLATLEKALQDIRVDMVANREMTERVITTAQKLKVKAQTHAKAKPNTSLQFSDIDQVKKALEEKAQNRKALLQAKEGRDKLKKTLAETQLRLEEKQNQLQDLLQQQVGETARISQLKEMLKIYDFVKFEMRSVEELTASLERGQKLVEETYAKYEEASKLLQTSEENANRLKGQLSAEENALEGLLEKVKRQDDAIQALLKEKGFQSIAQVQDVLAMNLNIEWEQKEIDRYKHDLLKIEQQYNALKLEINNRIYSAEKHAEIAQEISDLEEVIKTTQSQISLKRHEIEAICHKMNRRKSLMEELDKLELRKQNLSELCNLFRGNGFMNYVSSLYLTNLCKAANERFLLLTKNSLSLELNEQNEFIVRDYLNNGKTRLLKTLSGGQTFQASLCLALALAENVKSLNKADQSFFFLDEGFGALDKDALRVVLDTLRTLRKENRAVGIISHVEELQQEMDIYIKVENDRDRGSTISYSWQ